MEHLLKQKAPFLPFCVDYSKLLDLVQQKENINRERARKMCGLWTYKEFAEYLNI